MTRRRPFARPVLEVLEGRVVPSTVYWTGAQDTNWDNGANWSTGLAPGAGADVIVNTAGATIVLNNTTGTPDTIHSLSVQATGVSLTLQSGTLDVSGGVPGAKGSFQAGQAGALVWLQGGTLANADVAAGTVVTATTSGGTLDGVKLDGTLDMTQGQSYYGLNATVVNGLTLIGQISLQNTSSLNLGNYGDTSGQSIVGTGTVDLGSGYNNSLRNNSSGVLTIGSGIIIQCDSYNSFLIGSFDNQGTIAKNLAFGTLYINAYGGPSWTNDGTITAGSDSTVYLGGNWINSASGSISVGSASTVYMGDSINIDPTDPSASTYTWTNNGSMSIGPSSTVNLGGVFTAASLATLNLDPSDTINLTGTLDNRGATLTTTGSWNLQFGRIYQGTVATAPGTALVAAYGVLDGVQLDGTLAFSPYYYNANVTILNGLTLNGEIDIGGSNPSYNSATLYFGTYGDTASQSLTGSGTIVFGADYGGDTLANFSAGTLTIGSGITIQAGANSSIDGPIDNQGIIQEGVAGDILSLGNPSPYSYSLASWTNEGTISAVSGTFLGLNGIWTNTAAGTITVGPASSVTLGAYVSIDPTDPSVPSYAWTNNGSISIGSNSTVNLGGVFTMASLAALGLDNTDTYNLIGTLDNRAATLAIGGTNAVWTLAGGRIYQGTITTAPGSALISTGGTLDGVQLNGTLNITDFATVQIFNSLTLNGEIDIGGPGSVYGNATLYFGNFGNTTAPTLSGSGMIVFGSGYFTDTLANLSTSELTLGPGITIQAGQNSAIAGPIDNQTTIQENTPGGSLTLGNAPFYSSSSVAWTNDGTISAAGGTTLNLYGYWTNSATGTITVGPASVVSLGSVVNIDPTDPSAPSYAWTNNGSVSIGSNSTVNLGGVFTMASLAGLGLDNSDTYNLTGTLDNRGATLAIGGTNATWTLSGGRIYQGTVTTAPGSSLVVIGSYFNGASTLDGVVFDGTLDVSQGFVFNLSILNGLTLNGEIQLGTTGFSYYSPTLSFGNPGDAAGQALTGNGEIVFVNAPSYFSNSELLNNSSGALTIGPGITIEAGAGATTLVGNIDNQGTIEATTPGSVLGVNASVYYGYNFYNSTGWQWTNDGTIRVSNGANLVLDGNQWVNNGAIQASGGGSLSMGDSYSYGYSSWTNNGSISVASGMTANLYSNWTNSATGTITVGPASVVSLGSYVNIDPTDPFAANYVWTNHGSISIGSNSTVNLGGVLTLASLAGQGLDNTDTYNLTGTLDNRGATLAIGGTNPVWTLTFGRIYQGTITTAPGSALVSTGGTLDGVQLNGTLDIMGPYYGNSATILHGITLNGEIDIGGTGGYSSYLAFGNYTDTAAPFLTGSGKVVFGADLYGDYLENNSPGTLTIGPGITIEGGPNSALYGSINNQGTIEENTAGGSLTAYSGSLTNYDASTGTLTGGIWEASNGGNLRLYGATIANNAANIILSGAGSHLTSSFTNTDALASLTTNAAGGSLTVQGSASISSTKAVTNLGTLNVGAGSTFSAAGSYTQSSGLTVVDGTLTAPNVALNGGVLRGTGNVQGNVVNAAEIDPGDPLGTLSVTGNYTQTAAGLLNVGIGGTAAGTFSHLAVSGAATLGGTLNVHYTNGFVANPGSSFQIMTFGSRPGSSDFATKNGLNPLRGQVLIPTYHSGDLTLTAKDNSTASLTSTTNPTMFGQPVTFTATVASSGPGVGAPTGNVDFYDTTTQTDLGVVALVGGKAQLTTTALPVGNQTISLNFLGDGGFLTSSTSLSVSVIESTWILNTTVSGALSVSGNSSFNIPGVIEVDSKSTTAIQASGSAKVKASSILEVGGYSVTGNATLNPTPTKGITPFSDPLASLTAPTVTNNQGSVSLSGNQSKTINPGVYSQISVSGSAKLTMTPGIYVIAGGGFTVTGNGSVSGNGVMIYNAGSNYNGGSGSNFGGIALSGNGTVSLTAATTGPYAGILIFQSRDNQRAISLAGNAAAGVGSGIIYAPAALLTISGNAQLQHAPFVVNQLQLSSNGSSTLTNGADSISAVAGQLLAGDLAVYVDNNNGYFTADELAAIQDAIYTTDTLLAPYSVVVSEVTDPTEANLTIDSSTTSAAGGLADGVLGCYNHNTAEITLIHGWDWFAGSDPSAIGAGQYSFETAVTHELGHALGLGHSPDANSVMYASLPAGVVKRGLTTQDLNIGDTNGSAPDALHAGGLASDEDRAAPTGQLLSPGPAPAGHSDATAAAVRPATALPDAGGVLPASGSTEFAGVPVAATARADLPAMSGVAGAGAALATTPMPSWKVAGAGYEPRGWLRSDWALSTTTRGTSDAGDIADTNCIHSTDPAGDGSPGTLESAAAQEAAPAPAPEADLPGFDFFATAREHAPGSVRLGAPAFAVDPAALDAFMTHFAEASPPAREEAVRQSGVGAGAVGWWLALCGGLAAYPEAGKDNERRTCAKARGWQPRGR
jgi:hypothetical protein